MLQTIFCSAAISTLAGLGSGIRATERILSAILTLFFFGDIKAVTIFVWRAPPRPCRFLYVGFLERVPSIASTTVLLVPNCARAASSETTINDLIFRKCGAICFFPYEVHFTYK